MVFEQVNFRDMLRTMESIGFYDVVFPFLIVFTIFYGILQKVRLFGSSDSTKNINVVVAFVTAFFVLRVPWIIETIKQFLPRVSLLVIVLLMVLLILGIFGTSAEGWTGLPFFLAVILSVGGIIWAVYGSIPGTTTFLPPWLQLTPSDKGILMAIGIFVLILYMFKEKKPEDKGMATKFVEALSDPRNFGRK
ncbi:MAG: hypothetical protein AABY09_00255 [Nanoarchaeota archaeon]